jgi:two-component system, OmpR family, sensor kinase
VLAGVSHDLAGPLARIRLYAELIGAEAAEISPRESAEQLDTWSERIVAATLSMKSIIQDLLEVARLQMGEQLRLDVRRLDLVTLAARCVGEHQSPGRVVVLETQVDEVYGVWDEARLSRAISNLIDNALKYSERGQAVVVSVEPEGYEHVAIHVRDQGVGISAEDFPHVFDRFYRGRNAIEQAGGSGLGLAVVRQIVEQHGGTVMIESRPGAGTLVSLHLPRETRP